MGKIRVPVRRPVGTPLTAPIEATDLMLATLRRTPFSDDDWLYEFKYDGYRCLIRKADDVVELVSRNGKSFNRSFVDVVEAVRAVPGDFTWDAELTVDHDTGHSSFERLQTRARTSLPKNITAAVREHPARLYVFDMLTSGSRDLRGLPLSERKAHLRDAFADTRTLIYPSGVVGVGTWVFEQAVKHGFEGMVAKRLVAPYRAGRSLDWLKIKNAGYGRPAALGWGRSRLPPS